MSQNITKEDWVVMFREIGLDDAAMERWHRLFEQRHPDGHEDFLNFLGLAPDEIRQIRTRYR